MNWSREINGIAEVESTAKAILEVCKNERVFVFFGELGAGKTTLIKAICAQLGVEDEVSSPTYALVNEYRGPHKVFHFDLYRLEEAEELFDIGFEDYLEQGAYVFIEWPQLAMDLLDEAVVVKLEAVSADKRLVEVFKES